MSNQQERVLRHLRDEGSITPMEAISEYGIYRLAAVVHLLKKDGYVITTETLKGSNRYGEPTHWARYKLSEDKKPSASSISDYAKASRGY